MENGGPVVVHAVYGYRRYLLRQEGSRVSINSLDARMSELHLHFLRQLSDELLQLFVRHFIYHRRAIGADRASAIWSPDGVALQS